MVGQDETVLPQHNELWPLLCGEQHCYGVYRMFPRFGRCFWTAAKTFAGTLPLRMVVAIVTVVFLGRVSSIRWLKNRVKSLFLLWKPDLRTSGLAAPGFTESHRICLFWEHAMETSERFISRNNNNNNVHLSCAHQCPERSHNTY